MNTYVIVSFLEENFPAKFSARAWPLHVTIVRPFVCEKFPEEVLEELRSIAADHKAIPTVGVSKQLFGVEKNVPVVELEKTPELQALHERILSKPWVELVPPLFQEFRPHVSEQASGKVYVGTEVVVRSISLIQYSGINREVVGTFQLR